MKRAAKYAALLATATLSLGVLLGGCHPKPGASGARQFLQQLDGLEVIPSRPDAPGYSRGCRKGEGCVFGPAWSDAVSASVKDAKNGCDQASDVLRSDLSGVVIKAGTHGCTPLSGTLHDPYTGATIQYVRGQRPVRVSLDHIVPLKVAWDLGANSWDLQRRRDLAGDPRNLLAVSAPANSAKGDSTPADRWKPQRGYRCIYAERYVDVLYTYRLPVPARDKAALTSMLRTCP